MTISQIIKSSPINDIETEILLADLLKKDRSFLYSHPKYSLDSDQKTTILRNINLRKQGRPTAYILNSKEFYGLKFFVNPSVLIPRPETEELVDQTINFVKTSFGNKKVFIADVGTGSGCIAIALAKNLPDAKIYALDVSSKALSVARKNAEAFKLEEKITFLEGDLLSPLKERVDVVCANLPYVKTTKIPKLQPEISLWEPRVALDGGTDGWQFYQKLFQQARKYLKRGGVIFYEIDGNISKFKL